jgi:hypothetical protein
LRRQRSKPCRPNCRGGNLTNGMRFGTQDFDGFIVGATPWGHASPYMANVSRIAQHLQTHPDAWISPDLMAGADKAILAAYDASDGAVDGIIADERNITNFDVHILQDAGFSAAQITTFDIIRSIRRRWRVKARAIRSRMSPRGLTFCWERSLHPGPKRMPRRRRSSPSRVHRSFTSWPIPPQRGLSAASGSAPSRRGQL